MSSALPLIMPSAAAMSYSITSPRDFCTASSARLPPICPPPTRPIFRFLIMMSSPLHVLDDGLAELAALQLLNGARAFLLHEPREVVGHGLRGDGAVHSLDDLVGRFVPLHVAQHHLGREDHGARVHLVLVRVLRSRAVGRLEHRVP